MARKIYEITVEDRCSDCAMLVSGDAGEWLCDEYGGPCETIEECGEWDRNNQWRFLGLFDAMDEDDLFKEAVL